MLCILIHLVGHSYLLIGIFAGPKRIPGMSFVGVYAGEYLTDEEGEKRGL